jgi:hypothetical protein
MVLLFVNSNSNSIFKSFYDINTAKINLFRITINTLDKYLGFKPILTFQKCLIVEYIYKNCYVFIRTIPLYVLVIC